MKYKRSFWLYYTPKNCFLPNLAIINLTREMSVSQCVRGTSFAIPFQNAAYYNIHHCGPIRKYGRIVTNEPAEKLRGRMGVFYHFQPTAQNTLKVKPRGYKKLYRINTIILIPKRGYSQSPGSRVRVEGTDEEEEEGGGVPPSPRTLPHSTPTLPPRHSKTRRQ